LEGMVAMVQARRKRVRILSGDERYDRVVWSGRNFLDVHGSSQTIRLASMARFASCSSKMLVYAKYPSCRKREYRGDGGAILRRKSNDIARRSRGTHDVIIIDDATTTRARNWTGIEPRARFAGVETEFGCLQPWALVDARILRSVHAMDTKEKYILRVELRSFPFDHLSLSLSRIYSKSVIACNAYTCSVKEERARLLYVEMETRGQSFSR